MIERLIQVSLKHRLVVLLAAAALLIFGGMRALQMPIDVFPDLTAPRVTIVTEVTGMAAEEVEQLVTFPLETAVNGSAGLRRLRSASAPGISVVWAEFDWDTTQNVARQRVMERLQGLGEPLPPEASQPLLAPASSVMGEIAFVALASDEMSALALRRVADLEVRRRLLGVPGVSQVVPIGGEVQQYQVLVEPERMEPFGLTLSDVLRAVELGSHNAPGGYVVEGGQESVVRVLGRAHGVDDLRNIVVASRGDTQVRVSDVARVQVGAAVSRGQASYNARPAVLLSVVKQPEADTRGTTQGLDAALDVLGPELAARGIVLERNVFRQQDFIDNAIGNVVGVLRDGAVLVVIVLVLFLWSLRPTLISALAIPLSLVTAIVVLGALGFRIDTMTLGGLAIAIGELVDDAIVDVENVERRLRERQLLKDSERPSLISTVLAASVEVRAAIVSATVILMLVFVPLLLLNGLQGRLLRPLAVAYLAAIFASLIVAVTVTPVLCSLLLGRVRNDASEPPLIRVLGRWYRPVLVASMRHPGRVMGVAAVVVLIGVNGFLGLGRSFLPAFNEGSLTINMVLAPGTSLEDSSALATMAERALLADPGVLSVGRRTGRAERDEHVLGVETTEMEVRVRPDDPRTRERLYADVRERLKVVPAQFTLGQPISHRIEHMVSGQRSQLSLKVFGENLRELRRVSESLKAALEQVPNVVDLGVEQIVDVPQLTVNVDAQAAASYGLSRGEAARLVGASLWGVAAGKIYAGGGATDVVVKVPPELVRDLESLRQLRIVTQDGVLVPLSAIAEIVRDSGPNYVLRDDVERRVTVTANVAGADVGQVVRDVQGALEQLELPKGVRVEIGGQFEREEQTNRTLLISALLVALAIAFVVAGTLGSWRRALVVLTNLPLALAGGVLGVHLAGGVLSVATTIGFITLFGIATRNGVLLATRAGDLERTGVERHVAVRRAAEERLSPILMTAVTATLGLLPLALALGQPGSEIQAPMALVILTGLGTSTLLNMVVVPSLLGRYGGSIESRVANGSRVSSV